MQSKPPGGSAGLYYYRGRHWSNMAWSKMNRQPPSGNALPSAEKQTSACGETEESLQAASGQVDETTPAASR